MVRCISKRLEHEIMRKESAGRNSEDCNFGLAQTVVLIKTTRDSNASASRIWKACTADKSVSLSHQALQDCSAP